MQHVVCLKKIYYYDCFFYRKNTNLYDIYLKNTVYYLAYTFYHCTHIFYFADAYPCPGCFHFSYILSSVLLSLVLSKSSCHLCCCSLSCPSVLYPVICVVAPGSAQVFLPIFESSICRKELFSVFFFIVEGNVNLSSESFFYSSLSPDLTYYFFNMCYRNFLWFIKFPFCSKNLMFFSQGHKLLFN